MSANAPLLHAIFSRETTYATDKKWWYNYDINFKVSSFPITYGVVWSRGGARAGMPFMVGGAVIPPAFFFCRNFGSIWIMRSRHLWLKPLSSRENVLLRLTISGKGAWKMRDRRKKALDFYQTRSTRERSNASQVLSRQGQIWWWWWLLSWSTNLFVQHEISAKIYDALRWWGRRVKHQQALFRKKNLIFFRRSVTRDTLDWALVTWLCWQSRQIFRNVTWLFSISSCSEFHCFSVTRDGDTGLVEYRGWFDSHNPSRTAGITMTSCNRSLHLFSEVVFSWISF